MIEQFSLDFQGDLFPRYNIAPTQQVPIVRGLDRKTTPLEWGLVPFWAKDASGGSRMINARSETVSTKPAFRAAFKKRRCLVPADGYFEWLQEGKRKQPYWIRMLNERPFMMAGLWEHWRDKSDEQAETVATFTILTTAANSLTKSVHDRMPVILRPNDFDRWLDPDFEDANELSYMFEAYDSREMKLDPVNTRVNSVRNDDERCIAIERRLF